MNKNSNCTQHIEGIKCDVKNCEYHDKQCHCTASEVHVGPQYASCSTETVCATFKAQK